MLATTGRSHVTAGIFFSFFCSSPFASSATGSIDFEYISLSKFPHYQISIVVPMA